MYSHLVVPPRRYKYGLPWPLHNLEPWRALEAGKLDGVRATYAYVGRQVAKVSVAEQQEISEHIKRVLPEY